MPSIASSLCRRSYFFGTQIPACLWILAKDRSDGVVRDQRFRDRRGEVLFIDARKLGHMVDRTCKEFSSTDIDSIARVYHAWSGKRAGSSYEDVPGFCKAAPLEDIRAHGYVLTPGRYVGAADVEDDQVLFSERFSELRLNLECQFAKSDELTFIIKDKLRGVLFDG